MNPEFDEVLLTAYLDNEVDDAERAAVEEHLQKSESARKLFEELKAIRNMVAQLHRSPPSRNLQNGPWNSTAVSSRETGTAVRLPATPSMSWKTSYQRLASLAALIAVAVCSTLLLMNPKYRSVTRFESVKTGKSAKPSKESSRIEPPNPTETLDVSESVAMDGKAAELGREVQSIPSSRSVEDATGSELSFKNVEGRRPGFNKKEVDNTAETQSGSVKNKMRLNAPSPAPSPADPTMAAPALSRGSDGVLFGRARMNEHEDRPKTDPKPIAPPSVGVTPLREFTKEKSDPSLSHWVNAYFSESGPGQPNPYLVDDFVLEGALSRNAKEENLQMESSAKQEAANDRFVWRFEPSDRRVEQVVASEVLAPRSNEASKPENKIESRESKDLGALEDSSRRPKTLTTEKNELQKTLYLEFRVPTGNWAAGANRLRQLGIDVPLELPKEDILEFEAKRPSEPPPASYPKKALLGLETVIVPLNRELEPEALLRKDPSVVRVRVRVK